MIPGISGIILHLHLVSNRQWNIASSDGVLLNVLVGHGKVSLETMALGGTRMTIADGARCGRSRAGSIGGPFRSKLPMDE